LYFQAGFTWSQRSQKGLSVRLLPSGCIFSTKGPGIIPHNVEHAFEMLGLLNSSSYAALVGLQMAFGSYDTGILKLTPLPKQKSCADSLIGTLARRAFHLGRAPFLHDESARHFVAPALSPRIGSISDCVTAFRSDEISRQEELASCSAEIDRIAISLYGLDELSIATQKKALPGIQSASEEEEERGQSSIDQVGLVSAITESLSFVVGVSFGRWDIRYASGEQAAPELADPFAPLPVCPPGQLQNAQGLPARPEDVPAAYPVRIPWDGILVDDPGHPLDIEGRVRQVIEIIWKDRADAIEHEVCEILGVRSLRDYFQRPAGFSANHLSRYSKSRRQAPIYWPLSTASGSYTLWIYCHRLNDQTLFQCVNEFVKPKLEDVRRDVDRLQTKLRDAGTANERQLLQDSQDLLAELTEFHDELLRVAGLPYKPNLNDGVLITASPLWKLFRLPKWQKELKTCWDDLSRGEYDWAHLAYTIWPDRVKDACKKDRSIAIAHGLEESCEVKAPEKKAKRGKKKTEQMELKGEIE
jgi:hypothetical protein